MPTPRKPKSKSGKNAPSTSALDSEKRLLQERQRQIEEKMAALNRTISESRPPGYRINGMTAGAGAVPAQAPAGKRQGERRRPPKKVVLRAERQEGRLQTFALLSVVLLLIVWALYRYL